MKDIITNLFSNVWLLLFFLFIIVCSVAVINQRFGTSARKVSSRPLNANAKIVDIKHDQRGITYEKATIKTTVYFDDGFQYTSHAVDKERSIMGGRVFISDSTMRSIINAAISSHELSYEEEQKQFRKEEKKRQKLQKKGLKYHTDISESKVVLVGGWNCVCGRQNADYVFTCACGRQKHDAENQK